MKIVKFFAVSVLLLCFLLSVSFLVAADANWSADLVMKQTSAVSEDGTFEVRVSVSDITSKEGIVCAIYHISYDPTAVQLVSWDNAHPADWDFSGKTSFGAEDWTDLLEDDNGNPYLMYTVMNTSLDCGVTDDDVLYTDLVFKVLSAESKTTEIFATEISFVDKNITDDLTLPDQKLEVAIATGHDSSADDSQSTSLHESSKQEDSSIVDASSASSEIEESSVASESSENEVMSDDEAIENSHEESVSENSDASADHMASNDFASEDNAPNSERVVMTVLLNSIEDEYGISAFQFKLNYKSTLLEFVDYKIILPDNWDLNTDYTEDLCSVGTNGNLFFSVMNHEVGCGVKTDNALGFEIVFETKNVLFDPSLITMSDILLINDDLSQVPQGQYEISISYGGDFSDDSFVSEQDDGKALKIVIVVIACVVLLAVAITAFVVIRKKKQA